MMPSQAEAAECPPPDANQGLLKASDFIVNAIDPAEAGPGSDAAAALCSVAAAAFQPASGTMGGDHYTVLKVLVGTATSGDGDASVDAFLTRLGPQTRNGTVDLGGRVVDAFVTAAGDGYAYAAGPTVVIGYITPARSYGTSGATTQEPAKIAYCRVIAADGGAPLPDDVRPRYGPESYPLGTGNYTSPGDPGWIFFRSDAYKSGAAPMHCGIAPSGTTAGCDVVPSELAPPDTNQTVVDENGARYIRSDTTTFTRNVDALVEGHRLQNGPAVCWMGYQGSVHCEIGEHGFTLDHRYATLQ
ncbi:hypothetical protein CQY20_19665 [Mycolicibacterium agri]|uniref:Uncharacterized protein n=2 Tax=Mycolicibacterium agri TaxID=36811 RepID=A0A2A7MWB5_MYCAG|nr:hypothetical protein CQY20_19665 [Mycolicibacterium agri]GFG54954.1 hypothetical protein MAGR_63950 [Mycolicibacterium agri]